MRSATWPKMHPHGRAGHRHRSAVVAIGGHRRANVKFSNLLELKAYERAFEPKRLVMIRGGHFDPYLCEFKTASRVAIDWFRTHLA
jgi:hypothetical protein